MTHAGGVFLRRWLLALAAHCSVTAIVASPDAPATEFEELEGVCVLRPQARPWPKSAISRLRAGVGPTPAVVDALKRSKSVQVALATSDLIELQWPSVLGLARAFRKTYASPLAYVAHDVRSQALGSLAVQSVDYHAALVAALKLPRVLPQEWRALSAADLVWCFKQSDARLVSRIASVDVGVLEPVFGGTTIRPPRKRSSTRPLRVGFVADMGKVENRIALKWFVRRVWSSPKRRPEVASDLYVVGGGLEGEDRRAAGGSGVRFVGWVPDLADAYGEIDVAVAPMRVRGGIKFKVAEALAYGVPVVASPVAVEGYPGSFGGALIVARSVTEWLVALDRLHASPGVREALGATGLEVTRAIYDFEDLVSQAAERYAALVGGK